MVQVKRDRKMKAREVGTDRQTDRQTDRKRARERDRVNQKGKNR